MQRRLALLLVVGLLVAAAAVAAQALTPPGGHDPGPYSGCVNSRTGALRMVENGATCTQKEYGIGWQNAVSQYSVQFDGEVVTEPTDMWFRDLACPDGSLPLGGGGASIGQDGAFALTSSIPSNLQQDDPPGPLAGWEVNFVSVDGQPHTGEFQIYVICAPATN